MLALQFATATANLASQNAFLFLATHGPIFIASSSSATLIRCGFQYRRWSRFQLLSHWHPSTRCELEDNRYKVHTTLLAQELVLVSFPSPLQSWSLHSG